MTFEQALQILDKLADIYEQKNKMQVFAAINMARIAIKKTFCAVKATNINSMRESTYRCPSCDRILASLGKTEYDVTGWGFVDYCPHCGQRVDWTGIK